MSKRSDITDAQIVKACQDAHKEHTKFASEILQQETGVPGDIFKIFKETGECEVDVAMVIRKWNHSNCSIAQFHEKYTLVMGRSAKDPELMDIKAVISKRQAKEIIVELDLTPVQSEIFRNGKSWIKQ